MPVVEEYWNGVLRRLQAEVDVFNRLINHVGEMGRENEMSLARVLENLVPRRYGIGSGIVIDSVGGESRQTDIVIYDQTDDPAMLAQTTQVLFPVENVHMCIEVKTSVGKPEILDAGLKKRGSVRALSPASGHLPVVALVGFSATQTAKTIAGHLRALDSETSDDRLDMVCVLELGLIAFRTALAPWMTPSTGSSDYVVGIVALQERDDAGQRIIGTTRTPDPDDLSAEYTEGGSTYPIVELPNGSYIVAEPSRALLIFCEILISALAERQVRPRPAISNYISVAGRELVLL